MLLQVLVDHVLLNKKVQVRFKEDLRECSKHTIKSYGLNSNKQKVKASKIWTFMLVILTTVETLSMDLARVQALPNHKL